MEEKDPVIERNFLIFMVLTMALIFGWMYFFGKFQTKKNPPPKPPAEQPGQPGKPSPTPGAEIPKPGPMALSQGATVKAPATLTRPSGKLASAPEFPVKAVLVESQLYKIKFTTKGAVPTSWELKKYLDRVYFPLEISLKWPPLKKLAKFEPVPIDLVNPGLANKPLLRSKIMLNNLQVPEDAAWKVDRTEISVKDSPASLTFTLPLAQGIALKKIYTFYPDKYEADLKIEFEGTEADPGLCQVDFGMNYIFEPLSRLARINFHGPIIYDPQKKAVRTSTNDLNKEAKTRLENPNYNQDVARGSTADWAGFTDSYFLTALLAPTDAPLSYHAYYSGDPAALNDKNSDKEYSLDITFHPNSRLLAAHNLAALQLYFGPKEKELLQKSRPSLGLAIDYGWLAPIAIPLMYALKYTEKAVKNFGWSIIILTIILRMAMFPLMRKSQQSMKELQKLQPEMEKIRKKYPNDKMKQQEEIYALQRKYKINPLGGCLPMVVQIPIFFAFYKVLIVSIELRHAPWILWIPDLSSRDPLLILPLLMGLSQYLMQKLTPTAGADPTQMKMMQLMPLIFTFMLVYFPSGLLLYWTVSNIIGIGQQIYVNKFDQAAKIAQTAKSNP